MTDAAGELRMLQARAYGPEADIHTDPAALARLRELEAALAPPPAPPRPAAPRAAFPAAPPAPGATGPPVFAEETAMPAAPPMSPARPRRWLVPVWAGSLLVALVVGALAAGASMRLFARDGTGEQIATLQPDPGFVAPAFFGDSEDIVAFDDFHGLTALIAPYGVWGGDSPDGCIVVVQTEGLERHDQGIEGPVYSDCPAGAFPAAVQLTIDESSPQASRARFAEGTALQFVYDGERVGVFVSG